MARCCDDPSRGGSVAELLRASSAGKLLVALSSMVVGLAAWGCGGGGRASQTQSQRALPAPASAARALPAPASPASFAVGMRVLRLTDSSRTIKLPDGSVRPRQLVTVVRYPAAGQGPVGLPAPPARGSGPFPLIVFGHGFAVTPAIYGRLLSSWTRAGFVVAAPVFPLGSAGAPGGPDERDLVNQPADHELRDLEHPRLRAPSEWAAGGDGGPSADRRGGSVRRR